MSVQGDLSGPYAVVMACFLGICSITVLLRCYCRIFLSRSFGADDYAAVVSLVLFVILMACGFINIAYGGGKLKILVPMDEYFKGVMWTWISELIYLLTGMVSKLSILIFLLRIAVSRTHRLTLLVTIIAFELYSVYFCFIVIFQCWPVSLFWNRFRGETGTCMNPQVIVSSLYAYSALSCITDWTFSIVPIFMVWTLQMNRQTKILVGLILSFCAIGSSATIVRFFYTKELTDGTEVLYSNTHVAIWSTCELGIGIAASASATLMPLFRVLMRATKSGIGSRKRNLLSGVVAGPKSLSPRQNPDNDHTANRPIGDPSGMKATTKDNMNPSGIGTELKEWDSRGKYSLDPQIEHYDPLH